MKLLASFFVALITIDAPVQAQTAPALLPGPKATAVLPGPAIDAGTKLRLGCLAGLQKKKNCISAGFKFGQPPKRTAP